MTLKVGLVPHKKNLFVSSVLSPCLSIDTINVQCFFLVFSAFYIPLEKEKKKEYFSHSSLLVLVCLSP